MMEAKRITAEEVKEKLGRGETVVPVDTRNEHAWETSPEKAAGAVRVPADEVGLHMGEIARKGTVVTYCT